MDYEIEIRQVVGRPAVFARATCGHDEIGPTLARVFGTVGQSAQRQGLTMAGPPFCRYTAWRETDCDLEGGMPVLANGANDGEVVAGELGGCTAAATLHTGPYEDLPKAHSAVRTWITQQGKDFAGPCWESYLTDPGTEPDSSKWLTEVYYPVG